MERWLPIPGYGDQYEVSDRGRVRSMYGKGRPPLKRRAEPLVLRTGINARGRPTVALKQKNQEIHRLVLLAFVGPCPEGMEGCHNDGDPLNNSPSNLRWDTHSANIADKKRHGTFNRPPRHLGEMNHRARFTEDDIRCIRAEPEFRGVNSMLGRAFGCHRGVIHAIRARKAWAHVEQYV